MISLILEELHKKKNPKKAVDSQRFFKTAKGEYAAGDIFLGVTVPEIRAISRKWKAADFTSLKKLLCSKIHEERLLALFILVLQFENRMDPIIIKTETKKTGVGEVTEKKMHQLKIYTGADLKKISLEELKLHFGKFSSYLYSAARAIDNRAIKTFRQRKSIGKETTFLKDLSKKEEALVILEKLSQQVLDSMKQKKISAKTLTLKLKYTDFQSITRSQTRKEGYHSLAELLETIELLISKTDIGKRKIRLLGISLSNLDSD